MSSNSSNQQLFEAITKTHTLYHSSPYNFNSFKPNVLTFFFEDIKEAKATAYNTKVDHGKVYTYMIKLPHDIYKKLREVDDYDAEADLLSNPTNEEMNSGDIKRFLDKNRDAPGFFLDDYSQIDVDYNAVSIALFYNTLKNLKVEKIKLKLEDSD